MQAPNCDLLRLEYFHATAPAEAAVLELSWESPSHPSRAPIPANNFFTSNALNLANLSHFYRMVSLAKTLKLSLADFLIAKTLTGLKPLFDPAEPATLVNPQDTFSFVEKARKMRASGFTLAQLDYLLRHQYQTSSGIAPTEQSLGLILTEIRSGLQKIIAETTVAADPFGDITKKALAQLQWPEALIEEAIATLNGSVMYEEVLTALPVGLFENVVYEAPLTSLPLTFPDRVVYETHLDTLPSEIIGFSNPNILHAAEAKQLRFTGTMTAAEKTALLGLVTPGDPSEAEYQIAQNYLAAVNRLFDASNALPLKVSHSGGKLRFVGAMTPAEKKSLLSAASDVEYQASVHALFAASNALPRKVSHVNNQLRFVGAMTLAEKESLFSGSLDSDYQSAVNALYRASRDFVSKKMKAFEIPAFSAPLESLPTGIAFPNGLKEKIYYDANAKELRFTGIMTETEKATLSSLSPDPTYQSAIDTLHGAFAAYTPEASSQFLTAADEAPLFDLPLAAAQRFDYVLPKLLTHLRATASANLVKQKLAEVLKLEAKTIELLLLQESTPVALAIFLAPAFAESHPSLEVTAANFSAQFEALALLHKASLLLNKLKITPEELRWILQLSADIGWLNLSAMPLSQPTPRQLANLFSGWERLIDTLALRKSLPAGEPALLEFFNMAWHRSAYTPVVNKTRLLRKLSERTGWKFEELDYLAGENGFNFAFPGSFMNERYLLRLDACFKTIKRLGTSGEQLFAWVAADTTFEVASAIRKAAKSRYDDQQWLKIAKPLQDALREQQRDKLAAWLTAHQPGIASNNDLHAHYLLDVEMSACQLTSRLKQAMSSVQLFVQRCLMNLEEDVALDAEDAKRWQWMKNYRVWEANRKVFLYPENWIEPELRDGKSPFFKDMENELLQNEITPETVEQAYLHYLEKLDQVARLEIAGMYQDRELNVLHVFGRTANTPHIYFYRRWVNQSEWTPWEKVDLDIEGDHLIPVVWNRRLYLFWPIFQEKAREEVVGEGEQRPPSKYWEIKLAWSEYKSGK